MRHLFIVLLISLAACTQISNFEVDVRPRDLTVKYTDDKGATITQEYIRKDLADSTITIPGDTIWDPDIVIPGDTIYLPKVEIPGDTIEYEVIITDTIHEIIYDYDTLQIVLRDTTRLPEIVIQDTLITETVTFNPNWLPESELGNASGPWWVGHWVYYTSIHRAWNRDSMLLIKAEAIDSIYTRAKELSVMDKNQRMIIDFLAKDNVTLMDSVQWLKDSINVLSQN